MKKMSKVLGLFAGLAGVAVGGGSASANPVDTNNNVVDQNGNVIPVELQSETIKQNLCDGDFGKCVVKVQSGGEGYVLMNTSNHRIAMVQQVKGTYLPVFGYEQGFAPQSADGTVKINYSTTKASDVKSLSGPEAFHSDSDMDGFALNGMEISGMEIPVIVGK